ncbi:MAG: NADH-quinone oxidoreductase subunit N [Chitinophagaceae bacterium]|nr:MAG: NADH-quinone oxidoreductase subunit N [Chitinophagaceae bacterium]
MNALIISAVFGVIMMFSGILLKNKGSIRAVAIAGVLLLLAANIAEMCSGPLFHIPVEGMLRFERFSLFFNNIVFVCTLVYFLLTARDMEKVGADYAEYFALIFFILAGTVMVASFTSLLILFLGIEIISIPLYILTGSDKKNLRSNEASLKYFLMGAFSTGLMLMGIALIYGSTGTFNTTLMSIGTKTPDLPAVAGMLLLLFSMSFKVSAAPFHFWTPDVYDGAPTVFTSIMATIVKVSVFIGFIRLFQDAFGHLHNTWQLWVAVVAALTLLIGNITAVFQQSVKRMLAYSSISQAGFMLLALFAMNSNAKEGILLYSLAYSLASIAIFAVLVRMADYSFEGFNGLARQQPLVAAVTTICILSLAGIPLTAGFISKFYMLSAVMLTGKYLWLVIFAVVMAAVSAYYYFRVIQAMYFKDGNATIEAGTGFKVLLVVVAVLIILVGTFPSSILYWLYF